MTNYGNFNAFKTLYQAMVNSKSPTEMFQNLAKMNPNLQPIATMLNNGSDPKQIYYSMCQQRGINPEEFLKNITG